MPVYFVFSRCLCNISVYFVFPGVFSLYQCTLYFPGVCALFHCIFLLLCIIPVHFFLRTVGVLFLPVVSGTWREKVCPGFISETVKCRKLILGRDIG